jgi:alanine racemase
MHQTAQATINLSAIRHNLELVRSLAPNSNVMAVIKADAYGHGITEVANTLSSADGLAVARIEEALELRKTGIKLRLLLLGSYLTAKTLALCSEHSIDVVVHTPDGVNTLLSTPLSSKINVWLKLDSGMHRLGMHIDSFIESHRKLNDCRHVHEIIHMSHFSDAEQPHGQSNEQLSVFERATRSFDAPVSLANSAAIIRLPDTHRDWIRPGIVLYGVNPVPDSNIRSELLLQQAMTLSAKVIAINHLPPGEGVGYNSSWHSEQNSIIATVGIGYGDGYPRHAKNGTPVLINGERALLVGTVSMDLITVDITHCQSVNIGDDVILWSNDLKAEEVAPYCATIAYELFTSITKRVPRIYIQK